MKKTLGSVILSNFLSSGIGFLINVFLARILSLEEYGKINLVFSFIIILFSGFEFSYGNASVIFYNKEKEKHKSNHLNIIYFLNSIFSKFILFSIFFVSLAVLVIKYFFVLSNFELLVIVVNFYLFLIYRYIVSMYQALGNWKFFNLLNIANNIFKLTSIFLFVYIITSIESNFDSILFSYIFYPFLLVIISVFFSKKYLKINFKYLDEDDKKRFYKILLPLGISNIFILISMRADNLFIEKLLGSEALGVYAAANIMALMFPLLTSALRNVFLQKGSSQGSEFLMYIISNQKKYMPYVLVLLLFFMSISEYLFLYLYGEEYKPSAKIFRILLIPYIGGVLFTPIESYFYSKKPVLIRNLKFIQMLIIVISIYFLINLFDLMGAALALLISRVYAWIILLYNVRTTLKDDKINN